MCDDADLLRQYAVDGSEEAFAEFVRRHVDLVYSAAVRQVGGDVHRAKDVVQIVFTTCARKASTLARHPMLVGWLYTTTQHAARRAMRTEWRRRAREQKAYAMQEIQTSGASEVDWSRVQGVLDAAMGELSERDREALLLRYFAQRPFAEIGRAFGASEDAARMRVERALDKLRVSLARRHITSTSAALGVVLAQQTVMAAPAGLAASVAGAALAATNGGVGLVAAWFQLMATSKIIFGVVGGLLIAVSFGVATHSHAQANAAAEAAESTRSELAARRVLRQDLERQVAKRSDDIAGLAARIAEIRTNQAAGTNQAEVTAEAKPVAAPWDPVAEGQALMDRNPELKRSVFDRADGTTNYRFLPELQAMGLTAAQIDEFRLLMRERSAIAAPFGPKGEMFAFTTTTDMPIAEVNRRRQELLNDPTNEKWGKLLRREEARTRATELASALVFSETPLTSEQARQFVELLERNRLPQRQAAASFDWNTVGLQAQGILSAGQISVLAKLQKADEQRNAAKQPIPNTPAAGGRSDSK